MKRKKLTQFEKFEIAEQAKQARDAEWSVEHDELAHLYEEGELPASEYFDWLEANPRPSDVIEAQMRERKRLKRKSKKNIKNNITIGWSN